MRTIILILAVGLFVLCACNQYRKSEIVTTLKGNDRDSIIKAIKLVVKDKDTSMIPYLLVNAADTRISHKRSSYGKTIYNLKMNAIKTLIRKKPPVEITNQPDSLVIKFYTDMIRDKDDVSNGNVSN